MNFKWTQFKQDDFDEIKQIVPWDNSSNYPYFNETFIIRTGNSAFQLVAVVIQKVKPINFYS